MIAALLLAALAAAPGATPGAGPAHAPAEAALLRAAFPDHDPRTGWLGHQEGVLVDLSSACLESGPCFLGVAAREPGGAHAWSTFFAFRPDGAGWREAGHVAGPAVDTAGRWAVGVSVQVEGDGPFVGATSSSGGDVAVTSNHLWNWDGNRFLPVFGASSGRQGNTETETSVERCLDRPSDRPSWELRTREREGSGGWTENRVRVLWNGQAWVERPADRPCGARSGTLAAAPAPTALAAPTIPRVRSASASRTAAAPRGQPRATAPANAVDGDRLTAWVAGGKKGGLGEWLQVDLAAPAALGSVLLLGTCPGADWKAGPRLKKVRLRFEDGPAQEETLADGPAAQAIAVRRTAPVKWVRIELLELYRGTRRQDACVTEAVPQAR